MFFTISILWQEGLARSALMTGLAAVPFSFGSLVSAAISDKLSARMGRTVLVTGCAMAGIGLALAALAVHLTAPAPDGWYLVGPLLFAGLGSGMVIAPNQDFVLARVPRQEAGMASAILGTAQRLAAPSASRSSARCCSAPCTSAPSRTPSPPRSAIAHNSPCWPTWPSFSSPCCW